MPAKGNGRILYEVNNRGRKMLFGNIADGPQGVNDPKTMADVGNGFPMRRGYTIVWSGWDPDAPRANMGLGLTAPVATDNGQPIVQTVREEFVSGTRGGTLEAFKLSYEAAQPGAGAGAADGARPRRRRPQRGAAQPVVVRRRPLDQARDGTSPSRASSTSSTTRPRTPRCRLGFAATRDFVSWLRYDPAATAATGGRITHALAIGFSQAGRYLRHHISEGFNRDEQGRKVFDGIHATSPASAACSSTTPFAQPARTNTQHEDHDFPGELVPVLDGDARRSADRQEGLAVARRRQRSAADRDQHLDRVLAEGRVAAAHRSARHAGTWRCRTTAAST